MPLPTTEQPWPPPQFAAPLTKIAEWSAWYSGDPDELMQVYGPVNQATSRPGLINRILDYFWSRSTPPGEVDTRLHLPIASDIASTSADLLFSEPLILKPATEDDTATQDRLGQLAEETLHASLLEAAEVCAALGGVYLRAAWDRDVSPDGPWMSPVHADAGIPEWSYGRLTAVTFWWTLRTSNGTVVRRLERHAPGKIEHGVYEGTSGMLGRAVPLGDYPETEALAELVNADGAIETGITELTADYVPNMRPNRRWRSLPGACHLGRSDYAGSESLMDALDEVWSSLLREIDMAKARAIVPDSMLDRPGPGQGAVFDPDRRYFTGLRALQGPDSGLKDSIVLDQPEIRVQQHLQTANELVARIIAAAGYSAQTFGLTGDVAMTATEVGARERRSLITRDKKGLYWRPAVAHQAQVLLQLGNKHFGWGVSNDRPTVQLPDAVQPTMRELAETAKALRDAESASIETRVRMVNPGWDQDQIDAEVERIRADLGMSVEPADGFLPPSIEPDDEEQP